jgi:hypothetical protein
LIAWKRRQRNVSDVTRTEKHSVVAVSTARPDGDAFAAERLRHPPHAAFEAHIGLGGADGANDFVRIIFDLRQALRHRPRAR